MARIRAVRAAGSGAERDRRLIAAAAALQLASVLPQYLIASLAVSIREDFPFSEAQLGLATAASFGLSAVLSPTAGRVVASIGPRRGVILAAGLSACGAAMIGTVAASAAALIALMAVNGLAVGLGQPTLSGLLAANVTPRRQGTAFGVLSSAAQIAAICGGLALPLVAQPLGWRVSFVAAAALSVLCLAPLLDPRLRAAPRGRQRGLQPTRRPRAIHVIAVSAAAASAAGIGMRSFLVVFLVSIEFNGSTAGLVLSLTGLLAMASRLGFGLLGDRRPGDGMARAAGLMAFGAVGYTLMAAGSSPLAVVGCLIGGGLSWGWQTPLSLAVVSTNPQGTSAAIGLQMAGFFTGALVGPLLVGVLAERSAYQEAWGVCAVLALAAAGILLAARRLARGEARPAGDYAARG
jgi:predicted MFS family arabinose efflux permease